MLGIDLAIGKGKNECFQMYNFILAHDIGQGGNGEEDSEL